jgi:hypothetical protein
MSSQQPLWRDDIDALQFDAAGHGGVCLIHRLAFRRLLGAVPAAENCLAFFADHQAAFTAAAAAKIGAQSLPPGRNFHLNSRDVTRQLNAVRPIQG